MNIAERIARNRSYVAKRRQETVCENCGKQPIEWHERENRHMDDLWQSQVGRMANHGYAISTIEAEIASCQALCKSCHLSLSKGGSLTHCKRGHPRTPENTYTKPNGWKACRLCAAMLRYISEEN